MEILKSFICSKEKYLELKARQIDIARSGKIRNKDFRDYINARRQFYRLKGMITPSTSYNENGENIDKRNGFNYQRKDDYPLYDNPEPRYYNVIYALIKGKTYKQVEFKVRDGNELDRYYVEKYCKKYGIDYEIIKSLIWQT